jgi:predicted transcriptional regulator
MTENLADLPIADADRLAREQIEHHREQMTVWRRARALRLRAERQVKSVEDIAEEVGISAATVYEVLRAAKD